MSDKKRPSADNDATADRVAFDYIKSSHFRTIAPTGMLSSLTPQGHVQLALFSERQAIPQRVVYKLDSAGQLGEVDEVIGRDSIVREVEAIVTLDKDTATSLLHYLTDAVKELEADASEQDTE